MTVFLVLWSSLAAFRVQKVLEDSNKKGLEETPKPLFRLVAGVGFEPTASGL